MSDQPQTRILQRRKPGRPKTGRPQRVMVSVPAPLADAVKEIVRAYRERDQMKA